MARFVSFIILVVGLCTFGSFLGSVVDKLQGSPGDTTRAKIGILAGALIAIGILLLSCG